MPNRWYLGNDIVDLTDSRHPGKAGDHRFLQRVFSPREREDIRAAPNPDRALWIRWAGKEAAFKTVSKALGAPPTFVHPTFQVTVFAEPRNEADPPVTRFGQVAFRSFALPLRVETVGTSLHAVTWMPDPGHDVPPFLWGYEEVAGPDPNWKEVLESRFSRTEWDCVSHRHSALARLAARSSLASSLQVDERELEIGCGPGKPGRRIPKVLLRGEELPVDLTLSHHGRLLAWAHLIPPEVSDGIWSQLKGR
ncbi:MAG: 4'-phosphopantetheinyl transferase superfamily protein [Gemmatimonadetes bacterium]|nr:4'-phosphopantetheinyl transferase superfamily protein [Gemmatimonadota bacterium]NNM05783.1 4'-phosphopantetheinyl transferase superfamily protein [Gemmatimonadota bacterium]